MLDLASATRNFQASKTPLEKKHIQDPNGTKIWYVLSNARVPHLNPLSHADLCQHLLPRHGWSRKNNQHASSTFHPSHYPSPIGSIGIFVQ